MRRVDGVRWIALVVLMVVLGAGAETERAQGAKNVVIRIDPEQRYQTIRGFGASGAWWPTWVGDYPQEKQDLLLDLLFTEKGIALTIYRYNVPVGGGAEISRQERRTAMVEKEPGEFDLSADRKALEILRGVRRRGVEQFVLFANSPPGRLTLNGLTSGGEGGGANLRPGAEEAFAEYLVDLAVRIQEEYQLPEVAISPINEPQWKWGQGHRMQEGCHYDPEQAAMVIRKVIEVAQRRGAKVKVEGPESGTWEGTQAYAEAMFRDPLVNEHVKEIAIHSYWADRKTKERVAAELKKKWPDKELVMSEFCIMKHGHEVGMDSALEMAQVIHDDLTVGGVVSWQWWLGVAGGGYQDGLIYAHPRTQVIEPTKRLWVLGQYSRFVRPGYVRVAAEAEGKDVRVSAFISPEERRLVCVIINLSREEAEVNVAVKGEGWTVRGVYVTDKDRDMGAMETQGTGVRLTGRSVSTVIVER